MTEQMQDILKFIDSDPYLTKLFRVIEPERWRITETHDVEMAKLNVKKLIRIKDNEMIRSFLTDKVRFKLAPISRRSFKTELAKRIVSDYCINNAEKNIFVGLPTYGQSESTWWNDIKKMFPVFLIDHIYESKMRIKLTNGTVLSLIGFHEPERFEGRLWHGGILDEFASFKDGIWDYNIFPALSDTHGWCVFIGTPQGINNDFYKLWEKVTREPEKYTDYKIYHWNIADLLDAEDLAIIKQQHPDERAYRQEVLGEFVELKGRIYHSYNPDMHEDKIGKYGVNLGYPISIDMDFNKDCVYEMSQTQNGDLEYVFDEIKLEDTDITQMNNEIKVRLIQLCNHNEQRAKQIPLIFYGDYTNEKRRDVSVPLLTGSAWNQIQLEFENTGWKFERRTKKNPHIQDRINAMNYKLAQNKLIHSPKCQELKKDFLNMQYGSDPDKTRTHATDALGYKIHKEFPLNYY